MFSFTLTTERKPVLRSNTLCIFYGILHRLEISPIRIWRLSGRGRFTLPKKEGVVISTTRRRTGCRGSGLKREKGTVPKETGTV